MLLSSSIEKAPSTDHQSPITKAKDEFIRRRHEVDVVRDFLDHPYSSRAALGLTKIGARIFRKKVRMGLLDTITVSCKRWFLNKVIG